MNGMIAAPPVHVRISMRRKHETAGLPRGRVHETFFSRPFMSARRRAAFCLPPAGHGRKDLPAGGKGCRAAFSRCMSGMVNGRRAQDLLLPRRPPLRLPAAGRAKPARCCLPAVPAPAPARRSCAPARAAPICRARALPALYINHTACPCTRAAAAALRHVHTLLALLHFIHPFFLTSS